MDRLQIEAGLKPAQNFVTRHHEFLLPGAAGIERHEFDKAKTQILLPGKFSERFNFMVVESANDDGVDFDRVKSEFPGEINAGKHGSQAVASGDFFEIGRVERIEAEADALQTGPAQRVSFLREKEPVGGHGQIGHAGDLSEPADEPFHALPQQRFPARDADFFDAEFHREPNDALDFLEGEELRTRFPFAGDRRRWRGIFQGVESDAVKVGGFLGLGQAVKAAKVAAIGDTDPQVAHHASVRIRQQVRADHLGGAGTLVAGALVDGETILAPPDCLISTLRS